MGKIESGAITIDIATRHAQVVGDGPRIAPVPQDAMAAGDRDLCIAVREGIGLSDHRVIPEYMRTMIRNPGIFAPHMQMGSAIFRGALPPRVRELAVLRIGWLCRAPYEWGEHVDIAQRYGVTAQEVERVTQGSSADGWDEIDRAILRGVEELIGDHAIGDDTWAVLARNWNEAQLIEFPMMVGQYVATAFVQNSLRMALASDNPGLTYR